MVESWFDEAASWRGVWCVVGVDVLMVEAWEGEERRRRMMES